jgi:formylmethanofuran dehydrogenase subunit D
MIQVQNEPGIRDYVNTIKRCYCSLCNTLYTSGSFPSEEEFYARSIANHIEELAKAGKAIYDIPCNVNAIMANEINNANAYIFRQVYLNAAPHIDMISPDLYELNVSDFKNRLNLFRFGRNILYVAETTSDRVKSAEFFIYHVLGEYGGIGLSPWSVNICIPNSNTLPAYNKGSEAGKELAKAYKALRDAMAPIAVNQTTDSMTWFVPDAATSFTKTVNGLNLNITTSAWQGKGIIIQPRKGVMDFILVGNDYTVALPNLTKGKAIKVEKGKWDDVAWIPDSTTINAIIDSNTVTVTMPSPCALRVFDTQNTQIKKTSVNDSPLHSDIAVFLSHASEIRFLLTLSKPFDFSLFANDVAGRQRWTHSQKNAKAGQETIVWANSAPGIYFVTLKGADRTLVKKFVVLK